MCLKYRNIRYNPNPNTFGCIQCISEHGTEIVLVYRTFSKMVLVFLVQAQVFIEHFSGVKYKQIKHCFLSFRASKVNMATVA